MSEYCTACGTRRTADSNFCAHCEAAFDEARPTRELNAPAGHDAGYFVGMTLVLGVVVVLGILGLNAMIARAMTPEVADAAPSQDQYIGTDGRITHGVRPEPEQTPVETWSPVPTEDETSEFTPSPEPTPGNDLISVSAEAAQDPAAFEVVDLLTAYFTSINNHDYDAHQAQHTRAGRAIMSRSEFGTGYRSTVNSDIVLQSLVPTTDGRLLANITFTSNQNAEDGPKRQTCTNWSLGKYLHGEPLRIDKAPKDYEASYTAC